MYKKLNTPSLSRDEDSRSKPHPKKNEAMVPVPITASQSKSDGELLKRGGRRARTFSFIGKDNAPKSDPLPRKSNDASKSGAQKPVQYSSKP